MKLPGLASLLAVAVAFSTAGFGCEDDIPVRRDASAGRDGSTDRGTDGAGGRDGSLDTAGPDAAVDAPADATPDTTTDVPVDSPVDTATPDAPPDTVPPDTALPDTRPPDTAPPDTAPPDTAPPDTAPPDTALPDTALPDTGTADTATVVASCAEINCPALLAATNQCPGDNITCRVRTVPASDPEVKHICLMNGVKKVSTATDNGVTLAVTTMAGAACYTLEVDHPAVGPELWIFKAPAGAELARVVVGASSAILTCAANNAVYDITNAGCDGMEGEGDGCIADPTCIVP